jgi:hypothetical protein
MFRDDISDVEDNYAHEEHTNILIGEFLTFQSQTCYVNIEFFRQL